MGGALNNSQDLFTFDQFPALAVTYHVRTSLAALEEVMENSTELIHRLPEIHSGGRQRHCMAMPGNTEVLFYAAFPECRR